jgi:hypothetical protein
MAPNGVTLADPPDTARNDVRGKKRQGRPQNEIPPEPSISVRPTPEIRVALDDYLASVRPRATLSAVLLDALETYLQAKGYYPPKEGRK